MAGSKAYSPFTITEFTGLRFGDSINSADLEDGEGVQIDNFNYTRRKTLTKRLGWHPISTSITNAGGSNPGGQPVTNPANIYPLAIQRLQPLSSTHRIFFTDATQTEVWYCLLPTPGPGNTVLVRTPTNQSIDKAEWMIEAATPSFPYQMQLCRSGGGGSGGLVGIAQNGFPTAFTGSPAGTHITLFKDRIFMINSANAAGQESRVYFSDSAIPPGLGYGSWPANNFFDISPASGEYCVATVVFNDQLVIFKNRSIWVLTADGSPSNWVVRNLHPTLGCIGRGTVQVINGFIYFFSLYGVYRTDGTTFERISEPVDDDLRTYTTQTSADVLKRNAWYWDDKYILAIPTSFGTVLKMLCYDLNNEQWSRWVHGGTPSVDISNTVTYHETTPPSLYAGSNTLPHIYNMGAFLDYSDNNGFYDAIWRSKMYTWDRPTEYKRNYWVGVDMGYVGAVQNVVMRHFSDNVIFTPTGQTTKIGFPTDNTSYDFARKELKFQGAGYGRAIGSQVLYRNSSHCEIFSITWMNSVKDTIGKPN